MGQCGCLKFSGVTTKKPKPPFHGEQLVVNQFNKFYNGVPAPATGGAFGWIDFVVPGTYAGGGLEVTISALMNLPGLAAQGWIACCGTQMAAAGSPIFGNITDCPVDAGAGFFPGTGWLQYATEHVVFGHSTIQTEFLTTVQSDYVFPIPAACVAIPNFGPTGGGITTASGADAGLYFSDTTGHNFGALAYWPQYQFADGAYLTNEVAVGSHAYAAGDGMSLQIYGGAQTATGGGETIIRKITVSDGVTDLVLDLSTLLVGFGNGLIDEWNPQRVVTASPIGPFGALWDWFIQTV